MTTTKLDPVQLPSVLQTAASVLREVGFPGFVALALLYHLMVQVPAISRDTTKEITNAIITTSLQHTATMERLRESEERRFELLLREIKTK